ncbi:DUF4214 domain-containing protein [Massilia aerilata]|uniref:DUF4214 domain-containing protein n=1 Tax=Massilia aerilata TaxID=453817 RepID=A0ABW0S6Q8_9BURK
MTGTSRVVITADAIKAIAEFERFRAAATGSLEHVSKAGGVINKVLGAVGVTLSVAAFTGWIKGAIDATDAASDLSQKIGVAVEDLAGLELAFQKGGMESDALLGAMSKLSKGMADGNETLERLHVSSKNLDGSFKSNKQVLYELADKFAGMPDGVQKTALAIAAFGKSGADMIPMLNEGSEGLREMDEMAHKLGLSLSEDAVEKAGDFNDTLDFLALGTQGVARGIAAELLPTLSNLAGQFLTTMTSGDRLKNTAQFLASGLKLLYTVGVGIVEVFSTVGKTIGAAGAQVVALLHGDFSLARDIGRQWKTDIGDSWAATARSIAAAWEGSSNAAVDAMAGIAKHGTVVGKSNAEIAAATEKANKEQQEQAKLLAELSGLTGSFAQDWDRLSKLYGKGTLSIEQLTAAQAALLAKQPGIKAASDAAIKAAEDEKKVYDAARAATEGEIDAILKQVETLELKVRTYGMLPEAITEAQIAELEASKQSLVLTDQGVADIQRKINALKRLKDAQVVSAAHDAIDEATKALQEESKRASQVIEQSLTDALWRGFEAGKGYAENLRDSVKNMFATLVLKPTIQGVMAPLSGAISGLLGTASPANAATGGGSGVGSMVGGMAGSLFGAGGMAGSLMAGAGWLTGATTLTGSLAAGASLVGTGTLAGAMSGIGMLAGALGPIALGVGAVVALAKSLDHSGTPHTGGAASSTGGVTTVVRAESLHFEKTATSAGTEDFVSGLAASVAGILDSTAVSFGQKAGYAVATAFADDSSKDGAWGGLVISRLGEKILDWQDTRTSRWAPKEFGDGAEGQAQYLAALTGSVRTALDDIGLPGWANDMLDGLGDAPALEDLAKAVDTINATQQALTVMGERLVGFSDLSDAAVSALMKTSGGIDALASGASAYYDAFYTEGEKTAAVTDQVTEALKNVGLQMPATRAEYRAQVEAEMKLGEAGAAAVAVLLGNAQAFAQLYPAADAAVEFADTINSTQEALTVMSERLVGFSDLSDAAVSALMKASGGIDALASGAAAYYDAFYTEGEKAAAVTDQVTAALKNVGLQMPATRAEYRAQVEAQMTLGEAGSAAVAVLLGNAEAFAQLYPAADAAAESIDAAATALQAMKDSAGSLLGGVDSAYSVLQQVVAREKAALQVRIDAENKLVDAARALSGSLHGALDSMQLAGQGAADVAAARAEIQASLAIARASGKVSNTDSLKRALGIVSQDTTKYASYEDYLLATRSTQSDISELAKLSDDSLSAEEQTLAALQGQADQLDGILTKAQAELDELKGQSTTLLSIDDALRAFQLQIQSALANPIVAATQGINSAYQGYLGRAPDAAGLEYWQEVAAGGTSLDAIKESIANSAEAQVRKLYQDLLGRTADAAGLDYWLDTGSSIDTIRDQMMQSDEYKKLHKIPGFAKGGDFGGGIRAVGEVGVEIEATGASRIHSTQSIIDALRTPSNNNDAQAAEIRELRRTVARQQDALDRIASSMKQLADQFDQVTAGGNAMFMEQAQ